jgi:hypothetical protein
MKISAHLPFFKKESEKQGVEPKSQTNSVVFSQVPLPFILFSFSDQIRFLKMARRAKGQGPRAKGQKAKHHRKKYKMRFTK